jgi:hypothetical protein
MSVDPRAGIVEFLPLCNASIDGMAKANANSKATYRSNFRNPAVVTVLQGRSVLEVARMDAEVKDLLNKTLGSYSDELEINVLCRAPPPGIYVMPSQDAKWLSSSRPLRADAIESTVSRTIG